MTPAQCVEARLLLGWSRTRLASQSGEASGNSIRDFERIGQVSRSFRGLRPQDRITAFKTALEDAGIEFFEQSGGGLGVRLLASEV